jgi:hypothetical protein
MVRLKAFAINVSVFVLAVGILLVSLEVGLAYLGINTKSNVRFLHDKGVTYIPGAYYRHAKEGFSEGYFNSHGFRDRERTYQKPSNTFRILVLGDSQVEAIQVALENSFPALLERALNEHSASIRFEVLSLGQSGFGTAEEYIRYLNFGVEYSPDLVLLAVMTANDIQDNSKFLSWEGLRFYFVPDDTGNLVLDRSSLDAYEQNLTLPKQLFQSLKQNSYLASLISERLFLLREELHRAWFKANFADAAKAEEVRKLDQFSELNIYFPDLSPRWREAFEITKRIILKFKASVEERGAKFVLVTLSNAEQSHPEKAEQLTKQYELAFDYEQPDRILAEFAKQQSITLLQLMPAFRSYHLKMGTFLHGFGASIGGHWNEHGHRLAAEEIFKFLVEKRLVPIHGSTG